MWQPMSTRPWKHSLRWTSGTAPRYRWQWMVREVSVVWMTDTGLECNNIQLDRPMKKQEDPDEWTTSVFGRSEASRKLDCYGSCMAVTSDLASDLGGGNIGLLQVRGRVGPPTSSQSSTNYQHKCWIVTRMEADQTMDENTSTITLMILTVALQSRSSYTFWIENTNNTKLSDCKQDNFKHIFEQEFFTYIKR